MGTTECAGIVDAQWSNSVLKSAVMGPPFRRPSSASASDTSRSTGKERDAETGLDYFLARYYSAAQGRFTSPDEFPGGIVDPFTGLQVSQPGPLPYADIFDPQTLNKYAYVRNNPLRYVDPDGHEGADTLLDTAIEEIDEVVRPLIQSAERTATRGGSHLLGGITRGAGLVAGILLSPQLTQQDEIKWLKEQEQRLQQQPQTPQQQQQQTRQPGTPGNPTPPNAQNSSEHKKGARPSTQEKHEAGKSRKRKDRGGEKGDKLPPRKRPKGWEGKWPPEPGTPWW